MRPSCQKSKELGSITRGIRREGGLRRRRSRNKIVMLESPRCSFIVHILALPRCVRRAVIPGVLNRFRGHPFCAAILQKKCTFFTFDFANTYSFHFVLICFFFSFLDANTGASSMFLENAKLLPISFNFLFQKSIRVVVKKHISAVQHRGGYDNFSFSFMSHSLAPRL